jgi:hypothetical protein
MNIIFLTPFLGETVLYSFNGLGALVDNNLAIDMMIYFSALYST